MKDYSRIPLFTGSYLPDSVQEVINRIHTGNISGDEDRELTLDDLLHVIRNFQEDSPGFQIEILRIVRSKISYTDPEFYPEGLLLAVRGLVQSPHAGVRIQVVNILAISTLESDWTTNFTLLCLCHDDPDPDVRRIAGMEYQRRQERQDMLDFIFGKINNAGDPEIRRITGR